MLQFCTSSPGPPAPVGAVPAAHQRKRPEGRLRTLGSPVAALFLQAQGGVPPEGSSTSIVELVTRSYFSLSVLFLLGMISIVSWGIILYKLWVFRRSQRQTTQFLDVFRRSNKFSEVQAVCRSLSDSPLVGLFQSGYAELTAQLRQSAPEVSNGPIANPKAAANRPTLK